MPMLGRKKKKPALTIVQPEELSAQGNKLLMTLQLVFLYIEPKVGAYRPIVETFLGLPLSPEMLISVISQSRSDSNISSLLDCVSQILKAAADDQVSPDDFEEVLLIGAERIKALNQQEQTA